MNQIIFREMCELIADIMDLEDNAPDVHNDHLCANEAWTLLRKMVENKCKEIYINYTSITEEILDYVKDVMECGIVWDTILKQDFCSYEDIYDFFFVRYMEGKDADR